MAAPRTTTSVLALDGRAILAVYEVAPQLGDFVHAYRTLSVWVGLPPKRFARIVRAQAALRRLADAAPRDIGALAAELGYSDHTHLTREVQTLLGGAPSSLAETFKHRSDSFRR